MTSFRACAGGAGIFGTVSRDGRCHFFFSHSRSVWPARCLWEPFLTLCCPALVLPRGLALPNLPTLAGAPPEELPAWHATPNRWRQPPPTRLPSAPPPFPTTLSRPPSPGLAPPQSSPTPQGSPTHQSVCRSCSRPCRELHRGLAPHSSTPRPGGQHTHQQICTSCSPATTGGHVQPTLEHPGVQVTGEGWHYWTSQDTFYTKPSF